MFEFKQFTIDDSACAMKVGTDGVLLGAWTPVEGARKALDIGTGSGLIALMLAQRNADLLIDAVDIDEAAIIQARQNIDASPFSSQVKAEVCDILEMPTEKKYDLIVSNPPFYQEQTSCPDKKRDTARHTASLPFDSLIAKAKELMEQEGTFSVIIPTSSVIDFIGSAAQHRLYLTRRTDIHTTPRKQPKRTLLSFQLKSTDTIFEKLFMRDDTNAFSEQYKALTSDFYLDK